ncbi:MAG: VRR-NUC domain-containing protein [Proteobacteria bacterium]|nr:VRR-NUC domain-containing protein [Pseudomonadota bacterium]NDG19277.1 VRR-NUC domain-containing protein [Betaproteobacteria bacterium]
MAVAKQLGWYAIKIHGGPFQLSGLPDVLALKGGHAAWAEFKRPGETATRLQAHRLAQLQEAGCSCAVVCSAGEYREFLVRAEARA